MEITHPDIDTVWDLAEDIPHFPSSMSSRLEFDPPTQQHRLEFGMKKNGGKNNEIINLIKF